MAVSVTSAAAMQTSLGRLLPSRPELNGHRHSPSPPWLQRRQSEEEDVERREVEEEEDDDKKIPRRQKFSDARAFFERQERLAATCQLASPTGSGPRAKRSRVNEMAKLFQVGRPIPVEEFVVDLDTALPDGSPEIERKDFVPEKEEISRVDEKDGDGSSQDRSVDPEVLSILLQAAVQSPPGVDTNFEAPSCVAKRTSSTGVATLASVSPQLPIVSPPPTLPPTSLPDSDTEGETESARPPVEGQEDLSEETASFYTAKETLSEVPESQRTTMEEDLKEDEEEERVEETATMKEEVKPLKGILSRRGKADNRVGVVKLVSSAGKAPISLPQPQHLTISSSTESLLDDDGDEYQDVPVTDTSDEETNDYERLTDCISNAPAISVESFSGLVDEESVPNIDDGIPEHHPVTSSPSVTLISSSERVVVPRAREVAVEKGVHYLEDGNFFYEMEPRTPSESDEDETLEMYSQYGPPVTPPHAYTKIRFSDDPITVYSTHSPSEYNRRNELIDPISANAEYELEKQLARMNVFPVRLNKGLRGLGISIMGVGLGRAPGVEKLGIFIKGISAGGPAERDGQLKVLDQIVEVNGRSLVGVTQAEAAEVLRNTHGEVRFLIGREKPELKGLESGGCSIVRLVERSIQQQTMAMRHCEEEREERAEEENRLRSAPLAESEDLRSPCDRSPSQPNKTFLPEDRQNGSPSFSGDLMARLRELETENARMQLALEELHEKMAHEDGVEANERMAAMHDRLKEVEQREKEVRRERDSLERELKAKERKALQNAAEGKERETLLQQQISNLKNDLESSQSRVSALRFENDELSIQLKEAEEKMERITSEMNEKVRKMENELEQLRPRPQSNHSSLREPSDDMEVSLDAPESSSIIDVSAERHRASLVSSSSLAGRRRPSKGRVVSVQNDEVLFGVPDSNGTEEDDRGVDDEVEDEAEAMAEVFTSHGPDSTLSRGPRGGVPLLPGGGDILSMMRDKKSALRRDQTSQEVEDELVNESKKNDIYAFDLGDVSEWSTEEVCSHFRNNGFAWLESYVRQNGVDGERLLSLDSADMKSMGISSSTDRSKFKKKIKELSKAMSKQRAIL